MSSPSEEHQNMEDDLTCSICMEIFREPVQLSCRHNFCRECLELYCTKTGGNNVSDDQDTETLTSSVIVCPVCRSSVNLDERGVAGLLTNVSLRSAAEKYEARDKGNDNLPDCSMCEDDRKTAAVMYCPVCCVLYCQNCLETLHPMRGPLKRHQLRTVEEYLSRRAAVGNNETGYNLSDFPSTPLCDIHGQPYSIYCSTCDQLICIGCVSAHDNHRMKDISSVCENKKSLLEEETKTQKKLIEELDRFVETMMSYKTDVQAKMALHCAEVEKAYKKTLEDLQTWRKEQLDCINQRHEEWIKGCDDIITLTNLKSREMKAMVKSSSASLSSPDVIFLKDSGHLVVSLHQTAELVEKELSQNSEKMSGWRAAMHNDIVCPTRVCLTKKTDDSVINKPQMKFISPPNHCFDISENGGLISHEYRGDIGVILTDVRMQTSRHYWELRLKLHAMPHFSALARPTGLLLRPTFFSAGVHNQTYETCATGTQELDSIPCCVTASYRTAVRQSILTCCSKHDVHESVIKSSPVVLGFYLDCEAGTLTILNCTDQKLLSTLWVDMSTPVTPAVGIDGFNFPFSVRLIPHDVCTIPKFLFGKLSQHSITQTQ